MKLPVCCVLMLVGLSVLAGGCAVPPTPETIPYRFETDPSTGRGYFLYVPSTYRHDRPAPLIVTCHGTPPYDVAEHHIREWKWYGEQNGCIVLAPTLIGTDGITGDGPLVGMLANERFILSMISTLGYRYNIDKANVMITGFSGGAFPTYWIGLRHPEIFGTVVSRNGNFSESNLYWGQNDPGAIRNQSANAVRYLRSKGFTVETAEIPGAGHERHPEVAMAFFRKHWRAPKASFGTGNTAARGAP